MSGTSKLSRAAEGLVVAAASQRGSRGSVEGGVARDGGHMVQAVGGCTMYLWYRGI